MEKRNSNLNIKDGDESRGGALNARNVLFVLMITVGTLSLFWITYGVFYRTNRAKTLDMYVERQLSIFFITHDLLETASVNTDKAPPFANMMYHIENYIMNMDAVPPNPDWKEYGDRRDSLVGYGNLIMMMNGETRFVNGSFTSYFKYENGKYRITNPDLQKFISDTMLNVRGDRGIGSIQTKSVVIDGTEYLVTAGSHRLHSKDLTLIMYAGVQEVLSSYGFYERFSQYATVGGIMSVIIILLCVFLLGGLRKQEKILAALESNEQKFKKLFSLSNDSIFIHDAEGHFLDVNEKASELTGYTREVLLRKKLSDMRYDKNPDIASEKVRQVLDHGTLRTESMWRRADGSKIYIEVSASVVDREHKIVQGIVRDVSQRKLAEDALRESEEYFRHMFDRSTDPIFWADPETKQIINCNRSAEKLLERSRDEIIGLNQVELHPPEHKDLYQMLFTEGTVKESAVFRNVEVITKSGKKVPINISSSTITVRGRTIVQGIFQDITDLKKAQEERDELIEQLNHSQKLDAVGRLAGGIAHDFNNILATISGTAELLLKKAEPGSPDHKKIDRIIRTSLRAKDLTMKLLTFARKEKLNIKTASMSDIVSEVIDILKGTISKKIRLEAIIGEDPENVSVDVNQIIQALLNICLNACDAMGDEGVLTIKVMKRTFTIDDFQVNPDIVPGDYCAVMISDTGPGIPEHIADKVFEPFFTTKEEGKGSGLGLAVTHGIVQSHSGHISVENGTGGGATVVMYLPSSSEGVSRTSSAERPAQVAPIGKGILVVDDNVDFLDTVREILVDSGYGVYVASSGGEAIDVFMENAVRIDLVVLDMRMPGMDGADLYDRLREIGSAQKYLICSGFSREGKASTLLEQGAHGFIQKPFEGHEFLDAISELLDASVN